MRSLLASVHLNRLQRKVVLVVVVIVLVPMLVTGVLSADWVSERIDASIEHWIREAAQLNQQQLGSLQRNAQLFADLLAEETDERPDPAEPVPARLKPLAEELGITLLQLYDTGGKLLYSSAPVILATGWAPGQSQAIVRALRGDDRLLAAVGIVPLPRAAPRYQLVLGTLFDKGFLNRLNQASGLRTRLFYPQGNDFAKAFSEEESRPLRLRLPPEAFERLTRNLDFYSGKAEEGQFFGLYTPVADTNGRVEAVLFSGLALQGGQRFVADRTLLTLAILAVGLLLATAVGFLLSLLVVRPVEFLRNAVVQVAGQDFRASVPVTSQDELGDLERAFNTMAQSLREARDTQLRQFQRDKIAALGELALAMAHEIRNPIGVINTAAGLLERNPEDPGRRNELTGMIREESRRLNQLLKDFQQLSRQRTPELALIDPAQPLEQAVRFLLAAREEVELRRDFRHDGLRIRADAELLRQAYMNLVKNALEAMGSGPGRLTIETTVGTGSVSLALEDSGPGIPMEVMTRLFEPFFSTKEQGSGLGLAIASRLIDANGGRLEAVPPRESGARFVITFPLATEEA